MAVTKRASSARAAKAATAKTKAKPPATTEGREGREGTARTRRGERGRRRARLRKLVELHVTTTGAGVAELPAIPTLRSLTLTVDASTDLSPLVQIKQLNGLQLGSPGRSADAETHAVLRRLWKRGVHIRMFEHEAWPATLALPVEVSPGYVTLDIRAV